MNAKSFAIAIALAAGLGSTAQASERLVTLDAVQVRPSAEQIAQQQHELNSTIPTLAVVQVRPTVGQVVEFNAEQAARAVVTLAAVEVRPSAEQRQALAAEAGVQDDTSVAAAAVAAAMAQLATSLPAIRPVPVQLQGLAIDVAASLTRH